MADQAQSVTDSAQDSAGGVSEKAQSYTSGILSSIQGWGSKIAQYGQDALDRVIPPEQRATVLAKIQEFMLANPKLSTFLGMNIALTGVPLGLFILFSLTVFIFALIVGLVVGLLAAVLFTLFCVGTALAFVFPLIFFTTMAACFLFLWGLGGYYLLKWLNGSGGGEGEDAKPLLSSGSIGDSLNSMTGGRLTGFMDSAKAERAKGDISGYSDEHTKPEQPSEEKSSQKGANAKTNSDASSQQSKEQQSVGTAVRAPAANVEKATKATKATGIDNEAKTLTNTTGVVKGGLTGATGLG